MTKAACCSEKWAKFCHSVRRHMCEDGGRRRRHCCENHDSSRSRSVGGFKRTQNCAGQRSGFNIWARKVRIRSIVHSGAAAFSKWHKATCQNDDRKQTAKELYSLDSLQAPFVTENALLRFQGSPWGVRGGLRGSRTVLSRPIRSLAITMIPDMYLSLSSIIRVIDTGPVHNSFPHKKSTSPPILHETRTCVVKSFKILGNFHFLFHFFCHIL
jgi:hypothetical protein